MGHAALQPMLRDRPLDQDGQVIPLPASGPIDPEWRVYARGSADDKAPIVAMRRLSMRFARQG